MSRRHRGVGRGWSGCSARLRPVHIGWLLPLSGCTLERRSARRVLHGTHRRGRDTRRRLRDRLRATTWAGCRLAVLPLFVAAMLLVPAAGSVTTFLLAWELMAIASLVLVLADHTRPEVAFGGTGLRGDDPARVRRDPDRADGAVRGGRGGPVRGPDWGARRRAHRGLPADGGRLRLESGPGAVARLAAARAPGGTEPGVGADERGDGQPGRLRHRAGSTCSCSGPARAGGG